MTDELIKELRAACDGHPHAKIPWPHRLLHRAADALEAVSEAKAGGWMPIETAPKDGTIILAYRPDQNVFTAHFTTPQTVLGLDEPADEPSWWTTDGGELVSDGLPTHWRPLLPPPAQAKETQS